MSQREAPPLELLVRREERAVDEAKREAPPPWSGAAGLSAEEARVRQWSTHHRSSARRSAAREARQIEDIAREEAGKRAKRVIGIAVQRYAGEYGGERAVTSVHHPQRRAQRQDHRPRGP